MNITIDGKNVKAQEGETILDVCKRIGIDIPTLCYMEGLEPYGGCRLCIVEVNGKITTSCNTLVKDGMKIVTNNHKIRELRKMNLRLLLSDHRGTCVTCERNGKCKLQKYAYEFGIRENIFEDFEKRYRPIDESWSIIRDNEKCILCMRCVRVCNDVQTVGAINPAGRGFLTHIVADFNTPLMESTCVGCGQCILSCPVGAITEKNDIENVWEALKDPRKFVIVQVAPSVRASLGEEFGYEPGTLVTGKVVSALRALGFNRVFDTNFGADLTTFEEAHEFVERLQKGEPLFTSCCPAWVKFCQEFFPEFVKYISTCRSPQQMFGSVAKNYYAEKLGIRKEDLIVVSIMPCTAKKFESKLEKYKYDYGYDVDYVLTTRELAIMLKEAGVSFRNLPEGEFDKPLGISSGAAAIYGTSGGVAESVLRTVSHILGEEKIEFKFVRGIQGVKEAVVNIGGKDVKIAVVNGLGNARKLLEKFKSGKIYDLVEVMACPGGCIGGGGQPIPTNKEILERRSRALYVQDKKLKIRKAHENPALIHLYREFLTTRKIREKLLHTNQEVRKC